MNQSLSDKIAKYSQSPLFFDAGEDGIRIENRPYRRPTRTFDNSFIDYERPLSRGL